MKALVFHKVGKISLDEVAEPTIEDARDAVIRLTASAICGTDLHFIRGTMAGTQPGTILGHEGVGIVEQIGPGVKNLQIGDRVVICSTIACGDCERCQAEDYSQCAKANPNGEYAGTAFFGGPADAGSFNGMQAEKVRVPFADVGCVKLPDEVSDDQAILISDIFPTAYFGAKLAEVEPGKTVAVFGCGPVGLFAIESARLLGASRIFAVDTISSRLEAARALGAETIDYEAEDPVAKLKELTQKAGVDCVIDAVGVDANRPHAGPAEKESKTHRKEFKEELKATAPKTNPDGDNWHPGDAPTQALRWAVESLRGAGTLGVVGVYPPQVEHFPIGAAMNKNLSIHMGNCPHRRYVPELLELVRAGKTDPRKVLSHREGLTSAIEAYEAFDRREEGWIKVELLPKRAGGEQAA